MSGAERVGRAGLHDEAPVAARETARGPVDHYAAPARLDRLLQALVQRLPATARIPEQLLTCLLALDLATHGELAPQPCHRDVGGAIAELAPEERAPHLVPGLAAHRAE